MNHNRKRQPTLLEIQEQLNLIQRMIGRSFQGIMQSVDEIGEDIMSELSVAVDEIEAAAQADADSNAAAIAQMKALAKLVEEATANGTDPAMIARVKAVAAQMTSRAADLVAAANTPPGSGGSMGNVPV